MSDTHAALQHIARLADDALHTKSRDIADWLDDMETVQRIARAALAQAEATQPADLASENAELRHLLAVRVAGGLLYADDGELSDASELPAIDFKRDAPGDIARKLWNRGLKKLTTAEAAPKQGAVERLLFEARQAMIDYGSAEKRGDQEAIRASTTRAVDALDKLAALAAQPQQPAPEPVAWLCELAQEDGSTRTQIVTENPDGLRWNDAGEPSPFRVTPLYAAPQPPETR